MNILWSYLSIRVLDGGNVRLSKRPFDKTQDEAALAHPSGPEYDDAVVIALFWHFSPKLVN